MKVAVFGASGIVGQHMALTVPSNVKAYFFRKEPDLFYSGLDLADQAMRDHLLHSLQPDVIVNLAGENRVDEVERDPSKYTTINAFVPGELAAWCDVHGAHLIQVSSQAVFAGENPPYGPDSSRASVNTYGWQKIEAEDRVRQHHNWSIARLTFVLGIRPLPHVGRENPLEQMLTQEDQRQVADAWFSPLFAWDAASLLWQLALERPQGKTVHVGCPVRTSRFLVAMEANIERVGGELQIRKTILPVSSRDFPHLAPRPVDTTWDSSVLSSVFMLGLDSGLAYCRENDLANRCQGTRRDLAVDLSLFLGLPLGDVLGDLGKGFHYHHKRVAEDFRKANPKTDEDLLRWYRRTRSYCWELAAYHTEEGFNYSGMCHGIAEALKAHGKKDALCLGDGIGTLSIALHDHGLFPTYHDLRGSCTAGFATFRFWRRFGYKPDLNLTHDWQPPEAHHQHDAVIVLDFFEHLVNVEEWAKACVKALKPGGLFLAQNAFAIGSGPQGSIPCHLDTNDHWVDDWDPLLDSLGFVRLEGNWRRKPE